MATITWTGGGTISKPKPGKWSASANWSPAVVPAAGDDVILAGSANYGVTLDTNTASLNSLTINNSGATLAIVTFTLNVAGSGASAINLQAGQITIAGGTINDAGGLALASGTSVSGTGTLNVSGHYTGTGTLLASNGTLDVFGTIDSGVALQISSGSVSDLKIEGTATGAAGNLTINAAESITKGTIQLDGGTLTDTAGITVGSLAVLIGKGKVAAPLSGSGTVTASGGTLDLTGTVSSGLVLTIDSTSASDLKIDGTATAAPITINNANQTLEVGSVANLTITAAESITNGKIQLDGGTLTDSSGITLGTSSSLVGSGTVSANTAISGTSSGTIKASGGTLDILGTIKSGPTLAIDTTSGSILRIDGTATAAGAITFSNASQYLIVGSGGALTLSAAENITSGNIWLQGGVLSANSGLTLSGNGATDGRLLGQGTVNGTITVNGPAPLAGGAILASGGTLDLTGAVTVDANSFLQIDSTAGSTLKIDGTAATNVAIKTATQTSLSSPNSKLEIGANGSLTINATETVTGGIIQLDGGTLAASSGLTLTSGLLAGKGAVSANTTISGTSSGTIKASGGTLDLLGTVNNGPTLTIDTTPGSRLKIDGIATTSGIAINNANQTLQVGPSGNLTISLSEVYSNGTIVMSGGTLMRARRPRWRASITATGQARRPA
jgi:hypothetical protein